MGLFHTLNVERAEVKLARAKAKYEECEKKMKLLPEFPQILLHWSIDAAQDIAEQTKILEQLNRSS